MNGLGIREWIVLLSAVLLKVGIPIAFAIWLIVAIRRIIDGIKRLSSRLDVIEQILTKKGELEKS